VEGSIRGTKSEFAGGTEENHRNLSQVSQCSSQDWMQVPPEYKLESCCYTNLSCDNRIHVYDDHFDTIRKHNDAQDCSFIQEINFVYKTNLIDLSPTQLITVAARTKEARTLWSWVRIPLEAWMSAFILCLCCCVCR
jgi:hypothetical protein